MAALRAPRTLPTSIWILGFVSLLMDVSSELVHSLLPVFLVTDLGASVLVLGLIEGAAEATALTVRVFSGALSDWLGSRKGLAVAGYALGAASKPLFALAGGAGAVLAARLVDRVGKGIRGAPRDALVAELAPRESRGAAFGLRQSLDTVGAFLGPLLAVGLMLLWSNDVRAAFWVATLPGALAVALLIFGVREPRAPRPAGSKVPVDWRLWRRLSSAYWALVLVGVVFTLARFSEAFLILRAQQGGLPTAWVPLVLVAMNALYAASAYPVGRLADRFNRPRLLAIGLAVLIAADLVLARADTWPAVLVGVGFWGLHMGMTQGLLAAMVADAAPGDLRGTAFGIFALLCGLAVLAASALAGLLWDALGAAATFRAGAIVGAVAAGSMLFLGRGNPG